MRPEKEEAGVEVKTVLDPALVLEGHVLAHAQVCEPVPAENALDAADEIAATRLDRPKEELGLAAQAC